MLIPESKPPRSRLCVYTSGCYGVTMTTATLAYNDHPRTAKSFGGSDIEVMLNDRQNSMNGIQFSPTPSWLPRFDAAAIDESD